MELGKKVCAASTVTEELIHQAVVDRLNDSIDKTALVAALIAAANEVEQPEVVTARLLELLNTRWPPVQEFDDEITRYLLKRVMVRGDEQVEVLLYLEGLRCNNYE